MLKFFSESGFETSLHNSSSLFSFGWVQNSAITSVTGLCVMFKYKMSNSWKAELSLWTQKASNTRDNIWSLSGVHGEQWNTAWVHVSIPEMLNVCFDLKIFIYDISLLLAVHVFTVVCFIVCF